jgi:rhodanese-related sulfurtransferase
VVVCRSGARSAYAADALVAAGWDARNLAGGLHAWAAAGLPLAPVGGYVL